MWRIIKTLLAVVLVVGGSFAIWWLFVTPAEDEPTGLSSRGPAERSEPEPLDPTRELDTHQASGDEPDGVLDGNRIVTPPRPQPEAAQQAPTEPDSTGRPKPVPEAGHPSATQAPPERTHPLRENLTGLPDETDEQRRFSREFLRSVREGALRADLRECVSLILDLRHVPQALFVLEIHYRRVGDGFETTLEAIRTDEFTLDETGCFLESDIDLSRLPVPTWLPDGGEHVVTFPFQLFASGG